LVQEAFLRVYRAKDRYRPEAKFSTWLYRIGTNLALNESLRSLTPSAMPADLRARLQTRIEGDSEDAIQPITSETSMGWGKPWRPRSRRDLSQHGFCSPLRTLTSRRLQLRLSPSALPKRSQKNSRNPLPKSLKAIRFTMPVDERMDLLDRAMEISESSEQ